MKRSIHIEAPVEKVFDFVKDPRSGEDIVPTAVTDVKMTGDGVGTYYSWVAELRGLRIEGFDVYTEFVPNQRITDRCSSPFFGDFTYTFASEGSGTQVTIESHPRSFWRFPPLREVTDLVKNMAGDRYLSAMKAKMETAAPRRVRATRRAAS